MRKGIWAALAAAAALWPAAANAAWVKAETDRFVVYGEGKEAEVRAMAGRLTAFDALLRSVNAVPPNQTPRRKFEVYLVYGTSGLSRVAPGISEYVRGFYAATPGAVFAVADRNDEGLGRDDVLFHEYAHHFMLENFPAAYPAWFVEGFAEYFMTARITDKQIRVGDYNEARVAGLYDGWLPLETVLGKGVAQIRRDEDRAQFYAQAWLLMHYVRSDDARAARMDKATLAIAKGGDPIKSVEEAMGMPVTELSRALRSYRSLRIRLFTGLKDPPEVKVTTLPASAGDFLLDNLRMVSDEPGKAVPQLVETIRRHAARYPGDRMAELTLARAEFTHGDVAAGEAVIKRRLAADPNDVEALLVAGIGQLEAGRRGEWDAAPARRKAARTYFGEAFKRDPNDFRVLYYYEAARIGEPGFPSDNDINVLGQAHVLAPAVGDISLMTGAALAARGRKEDAAAVLSAVINNPHGGRAAEQAKAILDGRSTGLVASTEGAASAGTKTK